MENTDLEAKIKNEKREDRKARHILLVDDEDFLVKLWKNVLEKAGFCVTSYTEGKLALEYFKEHPYDFDIVITDQSMPFITGVELAVELRKIRADIKIILCTGYGMDIEENTGVYEVLLKPFDNNKLIEVVERNMETML